jgi:mRNA interferase MazF
MITSAANLGWSGDVPVSDLEAAGLPIPSIIRVAKIATIEARDADRLGAVAHADRVRVAKSLNRVLAAALG